MEKPAEGINENFNPETIGQNVWEEIERLKKLFRNSTMPNWFAGCTKDEEYLDAYLRFLKTYALKIKEAERLAQDPEIIEKSKRVEKLAKSALELLDYLEKMPVQEKELNTTETDIPKKIAKNQNRTIDINYQLIERIANNLRYLKKHMIPFYKQMIQSDMQTMIDKTGPQKHDWALATAISVRTLLGGNKEFGDVNQLNIEQLQKIIERVLEHFKRPAKHAGLLRTKAAIIALQACGVFDQIESPEQPQKQEQSRQMPEEKPSFAEMMEQMAEKYPDAKEIIIPGSHPAVSPTSKEKNEARTSGAYVKALLAEQSAQEDPYTYRK